ncbi:MAG TPA: phosphate ABC transporter permease subunit PstC [Candidatus Ligilactobacillus excrementigallinarum]|uniref:Phosphate transport system permease protein n=1 Tax=Candidatus Ligilactobacillus excrementigallinarum TaxID=2838641 RepID=A0A9D1UWY5_9LACO|nr:phosphate ABC transporter permease subunit PstC [Candidatus Ligilactobacillus excrementigallinarum]
MDEIKPKLLSKSKQTAEDRRGKILCYACLSLIVVLIVSILYFIMDKGAATFTQNHLSITEFFTGTKWDPGHHLIGALPMITTSFLVTILAALLATPFAIGVAIFMTEYAPKKGTKALRAVIELLVGIPSVVYGYIGLMVVVPFVRKIIGGTGFGILAGTLVLFVMILPTVISLTADSLKSIPVSYRQAALALGATKWQSIYKIVLRAALPGILTAIIFGMTRAFGEALAVQMVIGNAVLMPHGLGTPTATLTSQLTSQMGNTVLGTVSNNALWSLALILLLMSLAFNLLIRFITRKGAIKR